MPSKKSSPRKKAAAKKKIAPKKKAAPKKAAPKKAPKKKKAGATNKVMRAAAGIVAGMFSVVCDVNGVIGTFPDRASANACKTEHLQAFADHNVVVEGFQG